MRMKGDVAAAQVRETGMDDFTDTDHGMFTQPLPHAASYQPAILYVYSFACLCGLSIASLVCMPVGTCPRSYPKPTWALTWNTKLTVWKGYYEWYLLHDNS